MSVEAAPYRVHRVGSGVPPWLWVGHANEALESERFAIMFDPFVLETTVGAVARSGQNKSWDNPRQEPFQRDRLL